MKTFTSESVCAGHPDKLCDQISDKIVDSVLAKDPFGRIAVETVATFDKLILAGEITSSVKIDYQSIAREEIRRLGYTDPAQHFTFASPIEVYIHEQSSEIAVGVTREGAGDQGMMFGFACSQTDELMPMPIIIAHYLARALDIVRESGKLSYLRPDGKTQVTLAYENGIPKSVETVIIAVPHREDISLDEVRQDVYSFIVLPVLERFKFTITPEQLIVNGTGVWHHGGPAADTGLTGRKIVVDTYGGYARVGGGAFSGKDPTKVDRSGAYAARFIAKNIVAQKLADQVEVRLAYFIGAKKPVMQEVETFETAKKPDRIIKSFARELLDTSVEGILTTLDLRRPLYHQTASYGHFGRSEFPWEEIV